MPDFSKRWRMSEKKPSTAREFSAGFFRLVAVWIVLNLVNGRRVNRKSARVQTCPSSFNKAVQHENIPVLLLNLSQLLVKFEARISSKHCSYMKPAFFSQERKYFSITTTIIQGSSVTLIFCFVRIERSTKIHLLTRLLTYSLAYLLT